MIKLTEISNNLPVYIDPYKISGVSTVDGETRVAVSGNYKSYFVMESPEEVVKMVEEAIG